jgi:peptidoglycan/xylan/chitin deacetylase (PgdA/CDA1 family)
VALERAAGFRSSFNFVPERYQVSADLRREIASAGFEIGVHGLKHDGRLFESRAIFEERAPRINRYLDEWGAVGFRAPAMHHNLEWILGLNVEYDLSTFDTDPFEPQPSGVETVFPFWVSGGGGQAGYLEMPYTLPQDFTLFVVMREPNIDIWRQKLDWVVERGGMALVNTHPDYMRMQGKEPETEQYPVEMYLELLDYVTTRYAGQFWHALPREVARHCSPHLRAAANSTRDQVGETELDRVTGPP